MCLEMYSSITFDISDSALSKAKHFPPSDLVKELCHFVCVWRCVVVSFDVSDSVLSEKGTVK